MINDAHCHFFSDRFFDVLARQVPELAAQPAPGAGAIAKLGWEPPGSVSELATRWVRELDAHQVARCALIGSVPGEEATVEAAVRIFPDRFVGYCMVDPDRCRLEELAAVLARGLVRVVALFPAMQRFRLDSDPVLQIFETASRYPGSAVFVHCGLLTVGIRGKLGLPSPFDIRLGNPLDLQRAASAFPDLPILIPHFGAGFLREALMLASLYPNVHFDTSSSNGWIRCTPGLSDLRQVFESVLPVTGARRLLFGTDSSFFPRGWQRIIREVQEPILRALLLPEEVELVMEGNFDRLFPISELPGTAQ